MVVGGREASRGGVWRMDPLQGVTGKRGNLRGTYGAAMLEKAAVAGWALLVAALAVVGTYHLARAGTSPSLLVPVAVVALVGAGWVADRYQDRGRP